MPVEARPVVVRPQPAVEPGHTEGPSRLFADDGEELPHRPEDLDQEMPEDIGLRADDAEEEGEHVEEMSDYDIDAIEESEPPSIEVDDTPSDDAMIAAARIERFDEAHRGVAPVDAGPFEERNRE